MVDRVHEEGIKEVFGEEDVNRFLGGEYPPIKIDLERSRKIAHPSERTNGRQGMAKKPPKIDLLHIKSVKELEQWQEYVHSLPGYVGGGQDLSGEGLMKQMLENNTWSSSMISPVR